MGFWGVSSTVLLGNFSELGESLWGLSRSIPIMDHHGWFYALIFAG
jgi:hypothetical protein